MSDSPMILLRDAHKIPQLGLGVWQMNDDEVEDVVRQAFRVGYRHIDTAQMYGNEAGVGRAIATSGLPRDEIFVTTKIDNPNQGYDTALASAQRSLELLGLEQIDLLLIHWLWPERELYLDTWRALLRLQYEGFVRSVGVSNFTIGAINHIISETGIPPVVHQVETHPYFIQRELRRFEAKKSITHEAWSPLGQGGELLQDPVITDIAARYDATPAQVVIAWHLALGNVVIPKTATPSRLVENWEALDLQLDIDDVKAISALHRGVRLGADPAVASFD